MNEYDSYESDTENDTRADFTDDILEELKHDIIIRKIDAFKNLLCKEPEFYGINKISSELILNFIDENNSKYKGKHYINDYQMELFDDLYSSIRENGVGCYGLYNNVAKRMIHFISV